MKRKVCIMCRCGFNLVMGYTKPGFQCGGCDATWTNGKDGGDEFSSALNVGDTTYRDWITHEWQDNKYGGRDFVQIREIPDETKTE